MATEISLPQSLYSGTTPPGSSIPWQAGATSATFKAVMSDQDAQNPANSATFVAQQTFDGGQAWSFAGSVGWTGTTVPPPGQPAGTVALPSFPVGYTGSQSPPTHVRAYAVIAPGKTLSVGINVTF